ncbi:MAG: ferredoxin [Candidatus Omnitrophica bacterium]|nr:ferredoxin [Candidatus Omnitrophota bacterium]
MGCTLCTQIAPDVFKMESDKAIVLLGLGPDKYIDTCRQAIEQCPVEAISII